MYVPRTVKQYIKLVLRFSDCLVWNYCFFLKFTRRWNENVSGWSALRFLLYCIKRIPRVIKYSLNDFLRSWRARKCPYMANLFVAEDAGYNWFAQQLSFFHTCFIILELRLKKACHPSTDFSAIFSSFSWRRTLLLFSPPTYEKVVHFITLKVSKNCKFEIIVPLNTKKCNFANF